MNTLLYFIAVLLGVGCLMSGVWWVQRRTHNAGWVDVAWTASLGGLAVIHALTGNGELWPRLLVGVLAALWSFRLAGFLAHRVAGEAEDGRYRAMREHWGDDTDKNMFWFFQAQTVVAVLMSVPFWAAAQSSTSAFSVWMALGVLCWLIAVGGEALADEQLRRFKVNPDNKGKTCRAGLWGYSRHPNYFFEWLHWFTYVLIGVGSPYWWLTWIGPIAMLAFLYRLSGIPYTEKQALKSRGDDYRRYQQEVSPFFPWFKKPSA